MGAEYQIHVAVGLPHPFRHPLLLGHAPAQGHDLFRIFPFRMGQDAQVSKHPLLRVLPDGAGVQNHQVRLPGLLGEGEAHLRQHPHELLAVGHVLLAAEGVHARPGVGLPGAEHGPDPPLKFPLAAEVRLRHQNLFPFQIHLLQINIL